jgi:general secretion pathway protein K
VPRGERGAVLLMVLLLGAFASTLVVVALRSTGAAARATAVFTDEMQAEELGRSAADMLAGYVSTPDPATRRTGAFTATLAGAEVQVAYVNETARIDINAAKPELLAALFRAYGVDASAATGLAERVVDYRDGDNEKQPMGAELEDYRRAGRPAPANRPFEQTSEIAAVLGMPPALAKAVAPLLTTVSESEQVDPTMASEAIVRVLMDNDAERTERFLARRAAGFERAQDVAGFFPTPVRGLIGFEPGKGLRAIVTVRVRGRFERRYEAVLALGQTALQTHVASWQPLP